MVKQANHRGWHDWVIQRVSAMLMAFYFLFIVVYYQMHAFNYHSLLALFSAAPFKIISAVVLLSLLWHAWIGLWTVSTDYIRCAFLRLFFQVMVLLLLVTYFFWGCFVLFSCA